MPLKVRCSSCEKVFAVPDAARGKAVKCPQCESRVAVPKGDSEIKAPAGKATADKAKKKPVAKAAKPADSEDFLSTLDLRRVEDTNARICPKCGFDMYEVDEEESECPKCGFDVEAGGLGVKARKKQMRGPDPADFYPGLFKSSWKFVGKNQALAWRTDAYTLVCLLISLGCAFLYLWISAWPPRAFFALCFAVSFLVIPGWLWVLDTEVIKLTLERKDKFKKLNFDFFLASSKGVMFLAWMVVGGLPVLILPAGIGYYLVNFSGMPEWVMGVCIGVGMIPLVWMAPIVMAHMTMPIPTPGWMIWKVLQFASRTVAPLCMWFMLFFATNIPLIAGAAVIGAVWGNDINNIVLTMESNADLNRRILAAERAPKGGKNAPAPVDPASLGKPVDVDFKPLIGPGIILAVMCLPLGFIAMFNMRTNGQFTYFFKDRLELIDKAKEYKYVAKERRGDDDEDDKPRTLQQDMVDAFVFTTVFVLIGGVGGMLYGALSEMGVPVGVLIGAYVGVRLAWLITYFQTIGVAFNVSVVWGIVSIIPCGCLVFYAANFEQCRKLVFQFLSIVFYAMVIVVTFVVVGVALFSQGVQDAQQQQQQQADPSPMMMPGMPPNQGMAPGPGGAHGPAGAHGPGGAHGGAPAPTGPGGAHGS